MTAATSRPTSANALNDLQNVVAHGFTGGEIVIFNGAWVLASADSLANCAGSVMVSIVPTVDTFYVSQVGDVGPFASPPGPFIPGVQYYLDPNPLNAGKLTTTKPSTIGQVILPCFVAKDAANGFFYGGSGELIQSPSEFQWMVVNSNTTMIPNTGYYVNSAGNVNMTLPANFSQGDEIQIALINTGSFTILQNVGQSIIVGSGGSTTPGVGGSIFVDNFGYVNITGVTPNTTLFCKPPFGSITVT